MAKPGDVVEFRSGRFGIEAPRNIAVLVRRWRKKGTPWVELITLDGPKELKAEHLTKRAFRVQIPDLKRVEDVKGRLRDLVAQHATGGLAEEAEDDLGALEEALWEAVCDQGALDEEAIATAHYGSPSPQQLRDVRAALQRCRRPGVGRFEVTEKGDVWRAWSRDERAQAQDAWKALEDVRRRLVVREETEDGPRFVAQEWSAVANEQETLAWVKAAMVQFVEHDGVPEAGVCGIGGLGMVQAWGMDLHRILGFLAQDWNDSPATTRSSDYIHFLLRSGLWTPDDAVQSLMRRHVNQEPFFEHVADAAAEAAAAELPDPAPEPGRVDLRHLLCHTIDPPDAKDFDDAVGIEQTPDGERLWVHIADVSHYVQQGTLLDRHAKQRATSVYLPGRVLPMLPARIADHLCSLRDDGDRFALSVAMDIDRDGRVVKTTPHRSLIRVDENLSYADALERAAAGEAPFAGLLALAARMRKHRAGIDLDLDERRIQMSDGGFLVETKRGNDATRMIETFMVAANEAVATLLDNEEVPALYRCHPVPEPERVRRYEGQLKTMGHDIPFDLPAAAKADRTQSLLDALKAGGSVDLMAGGALADAPEPEPVERGFAAMSQADREAWLAPFRACTQALGDSARDSVARMRMLACMEQAFYSPDNEGHFGLGLTHYCHFTSPIRRYPDLVVHRNLAWLIGGKDGPMPHPADALRTLCDHCSDQERAAESLERRVRRACLVLAGLGKGGEGAARITGISPTALWLTFSDGIEARAGMRELPGAPYHVDEFESMLFVSDREDPTRFEADDWKRFTQWLDDETGEVRRVRAILGDVVAAKATGRNVADGRTDATVVGWRV